MGEVTFTDTYYVTSYGNHTQSIRVYFSESYNAATNKTTVSITGISIQADMNHGDSAISGTVKINGTTMITLTGGTVYRATVNTSFNSVSNASGGSVVINHNDSGAASMTVSLESANGVFGAYSTTAGNKMYGVRTTTSKSVNLTTHPRGSTIASCPSTATTNANFTMTMNVMASGNYHIATFKYNNQTTLYTSSSFGSSLSFTIPRSWFTNYPSITSMPVTVSVQTYNSSNQAVGSAVSASFTLNADSDMKPAVSTGWATAAAYNTGAVQNITGYVKGYSKAEITFDSTKISLEDDPGASIASYSVTCQEETVSSSPYRTPVLGATSVNVVCTVTDSRGRSASETLTLSVMDYANPTLTGQQIFRCDSSSQPDDDGTYFSVKATITVSSLNSQNTGTLTVAYKVAGGSYGSETTLTSGTASRLGTISADSSYTVRITATDSLGNAATYYGTIPTRKWAMKFRPQGQGVAFGKSAETNELFEITEDWDVLIGGDLTVLGNINGGGGGGGGGTMYFPQQAVSVATNAEIFRITNAAITTQTIVTEVVFAGNVTSVTWTSYDGYIAFTGTCAAATTADVTLANAETPSPQTPLAIANGGTGANTAAGALTNLGLATALKYIGTNPSGYNINTASNASGYGWMNYGQVSGDFPNNVGYGMLVHLKGDNDTAIQLYINDSHFCTRQYANSSWSAWRIL